MSRSPTQTSTVTPVAGRAAVPRHRQSGPARGRSFVEDGVPRHTVARHPGDGWQLAAPCRLSRRGERVFRGLMRVFIPPPPAPALTPDLEQTIVDQALRLLMYMHPMTRLGMRLALALVDWSPRFRFVSWRRLHKLDQARAERLLDRLGHSRIPILRTFVFVVRGLILSVYFDQTKVHRALGYDPETFINERIAVRRRLLRGVAATPDDQIGRYSEAAS